MSTPTDTKELTIAATVKAMAPEFSKLLKATNTNPDRFMNNALLAIANSPDIQKGEVSRRSVFDVVSRASNDGLMLDGKEAAIVIGWNGKTRQKEAQYRRMSGGVMTMIRRSSDIERVACQLVHANDDFVVDFVTEDAPIKHTITPDALKTGRGEVVGVYFVAKLKSGEWTSPEVMSVDDVNEVRDKFSQKDKEGNFSKMWRDAWGEAARKTVLHRAVKRLPLGESSMPEADDEELETIMDNETGEIAAVAEKPKRGRKAADVVAAAAKAQDDAAEEPEPEYTEAEYEHVEESELPI